VRDEVRAFLRAWVDASVARDAERSSDLYLRDPAPLVTFSDGARATDWLDVHVRLQRDLARTVVERIDVHGIDTHDIADDVLALAYDYDLHVRDVWGTPTVAHRHATMTLVRTKDGLRVATAHFSIAV
jgi:ketosteroid isomerase-like protein